MGWNNPAVPWSELERVLSGRGDGRPRVVDPLAFDADGGDSPAWTRKRQPYQAPALVRKPATVDYAELHCHSNFSFLDGASHPEELAEEAARLGLTGLAITDHDGFYGVVRFSEAAKANHLPTIFGAELSLDLPRPQNGEPDPAGAHLLVLARNEHGYAQLSRTISAAQLLGKEKGKPDYQSLAQVAYSLQDVLVLTGCRKGHVPAALARGGVAAARTELDRLVALFGTDRVAVELTCQGDPLDDERNDALAELADEFRLPTVATNNVHYHAPARQRLAAVVAAVRARRSLDELDGWLPAAGTAHLRSGAEMAARFAAWPGAVARAAAYGEELAFDLKLVAPKLPDYPIPEPGHTEMSWLRELTYQRARVRYPDKPEAMRQIEHELGMIERLGFPGYFLVVFDIVEFCKENGIYCQGRGSAANSAVCYALGITNVDPIGRHLLFERFLAPERDGPPDIDIDIESDRREEVIQHVFDKYDRRHTAQVANVISYRPRSAVRDVAKAFGFSPGQQDAWSKQIEHWYGSAAGATADVDDVPPHVVAYANELQTFPRHLGIHSGGMVICDRPIVDVCPVEHARMPNRTVLQWDKDDCAAIDLVKFDLLGLGMLSALRYAFELIAASERSSAESSLRLASVAEGSDAVGFAEVRARASVPSNRSLRNHGVSAGWQTSTGARVVGRSTPAALTGARTRLLTSVDLPPPVGPPTTTSNGASRWVSRGRR